MIQQNTLHQPEIHPRHAMLHSKYRDLAITLSSSRSEWLPRAATLIPSSGKGIAFQRPIAPVGAALLCILEPATDSRLYLADSPYVFRGYRGQYLAPSGETIWEQQDWFDFPVTPETYATEHDERLMRSPRFLDTLIGLGRVVQKLGQQARCEDWRLTLPATLLGFEPDQDGLIEHLMNRPTWCVQHHAQENGLTNAQSWQALDSMTRVDGDTEMTGLRLIDSRLCTDDHADTGHLPTVLSAYHDMRPLLGRACSNPARKLTADEMSQLTKLIEVENNPKQAVQALRSVTPRQNAEGCTDGDLLFALQNPERALYASRIARRQGW